MSSLNVYAVDVINMIVFSRVSLIILSYTNFRVQTENVDLQP